MGNKNKHNKGKSARKYLKEMSRRNSNTKREIKDIHGRVIKNPLLVKGLGSYDCYDIHDGLYELVEAVLIPSDYWRSCFNEFIAIGYSGPGGYYDFTLIAYCRNDVTKDMITSYIESRNIESPIILLNMDT